VRELAGDPVDSFEDAYERAAALDPEDLDALLNLAEVRVRRGRVLDAQDLWRQVVSLLQTDRELEPDELDTQGWALMRLGEFEPAAASLGAAAALSPNLYPMFDLGLDLLLWGRVEDALDQYENAVRRQRAMPDVGRRLSLLRVALHDLGLVAAYPGVPDAEARERIEGLLRRSQHEVTEGTP
jgi:tetratricopeptide (TPR) repeat protein